MSSDERNIGTCQIPSQLSVLSLCFAAKREVDRPRHIVSKEVRPASDATSRDKKPSAKTWRRKVTKLYYHVLPHLSLGSLNRSLVKSLQVADVLTCISYLFRWFPAYDGKFVGAIVSPDAMIIDNCIAFP